MSRRLLASRFAFGISLTVYVVVLLIIMAPVLTASIGSDDTYFTLRAIASSNGSLLGAATGQLGSIFAPDMTGEQPRTVPLAITARMMLAVVVLSIGVTFSIPLTVLWSLAKAALLVATFASIAALLWQVRFRTRDGEIRGIQRSTTAFILLAVPLVMALGVKAQTIGGLNGWVEYPTLTYGAVPVIFGTVALALWLIRKLEGNYRAWVWPSVILLGLVAIVLNYSYEFVAVAIPVAAVAIVLHPRTSRRSGWAAWKPALTVAGALLGVFTALFVFNRWQLSTWPCVQDGSCYGGSVIEISPSTLWDNFVGALPSSITPTIESVMNETGRTLPAPFTPWGIAIGLLAVLSLVAVQVAYRVKRSVRPMPATSSPHLHDLSDARGLIIVATISLLTAVGVSVVSGITSRAIEWVQSPELPYRSGVAVWTCIAVIAVIGVRFLLQHLPRRGQPVVISLLGAAVVATVAHMLPLNTVVAQAERATAHTQIVDAIHWDVVLGDLTAEGDALRCDHAAEYTNIVGTSEYYNRTLIGADGAFEHFYGIPYCSTLDPASERQE